LQFNLVPKETKIVCLHPFIAKFSGQIFQPEQPAAQIQLTADLLNQLLNARESASYYPALKVEKHNEALTCGFYSITINKECQQYVQLK